MLVLRGANKRNQQRKSRRRGVNIGTVKITLVVPKALLDNQNVPRLKISGRCFPKERRAANVSSPSTRRYVDGEGRASANRLGGKSRRTESDRGGRASRAGNEEVGYSSGWPGPYFQSLFASKEMYSSPAPLISNYKSETTRRGLHPQSFSLPSSPPAHFPFVCQAIQR